MVKISHYRDNKGSDFLRVPCPPQPYSPPDEASDTVIRMAKSNEAMPAKRFVPSPDRKRFHPAAIGLRRTRDTEEVTPLVVR